MLWWVGGRGVETHGDTRNESASWCQVRLQTNALEHCAWEHYRDRDWMDVVVSRRGVGGGYIGTQGTSHCPVAKVTSKPMRPSIEPAEFLQWNPRTTLAIFTLTHMVRCHASINRSEREKKNHVSEGHSLQQAGMFTKWEKRDPARTNI